MPESTWHCGELLEETGLVPPNFPRTAAATRALVDSLAEGSGNSEWVEVLRESTAALGTFSYVCRLTTPDHVPIRFATDFVHVHWADAQTPVVDDGELVDAAFVRPAVALDEWRHGRRLIAPPLSLLEFLADHGTRDFVAAAATSAAAITTGAVPPARSAHPPCGPRPRRTAW